MCRMAATVGIEPDLARFLVDRSLLAALHEDNGQVDGYGIGVGTDSDVYLLVKGAGAYTTAPYWFEMPELANAQVVVGHLRAASKNTEIGEKEAHPYLMRTDLGAILFQHNGNVAASVGIGSAIDPKAPRTDSYMAAVELVDYINQTRQLSVPSLASWASMTFTSEDKFVFFIVHRSTLYVVRGTPARTMYIARVGDGYVLHTSKDALQHATRFAKLAVSLEEIPPYTVVSISRQGVEIGSFQLSPPFFYVGAGATVSGSKSTTAATTAGAASATSATSATSAASANLATAVTRILPLPYAAVYQRQVQVQDLAALMIARHKVCEMLNFDVEDEHIMYAILYLSHHRGITLHAAAYALLQRIATHTHKRWFAYAFRDWKDIVQSKQMNYFIHGMQNQFKLPTPLVEDNWEDAARTYMQIKQDKQDKQAAQATQAAQITDEKEEADATRN